MGADARAVEAVKAVAAVLVLGLSACSAVDPSRVADEPGWSVVEAVPVRLQKGEADCGAAALAMVLARWGKPEEACLLLASNAGAEGGIRAGTLRDLARQEGLEAYVVRGTLEDLESEIAKGHPVIVGLVKDRVSHYEVVAGVDAARRDVLLIDPARGWRREGLERFIAGWESAGRVALVAFPTYP